MACSTSDNYAENGNNNCNGDGFEGVSTSLHEYVLRATGITASSASSPEVTALSHSSSTSSFNGSSVALSPSIIAQLRHTKMIASDVDGTLLSSSSSSSAANGNVPVLHPRTRRALYNAMQAVNDSDHPLQCVCLATGKTRRGALSSILVSSLQDYNVGDKDGDEFARLLSQVPGAFIQGLYCVAGDGTIVRDQRLDRAPTLAVVAAVCISSSSSSSSFTLFAYRKDSIFYVPQWSQPDHVHELHLVWGEPKPLPVESFEQLLDTPPDGRIHKLLLMDSDIERVSSILRPQLQAIADPYGCTVTQAVPTMLELLPPGCTKASGVVHLCRALNNIIDPSTGLVAIGDAENDIELLQMASVGFAVGNAAHKVQEAADVVLPQNNNEGGAGVAIELVLEQLSNNKR